jgi:capsular exopolysaccharide synthesis family protein
MQIGPIADALHEEAFGKFAQFLKRRIWWITGGVVLGLAVATALNVLEPKMYTSFAQIEIATDQSSQFRLEPVPGLDAIGAGDSERLDTEIQILKSKTLAMETIQLLHLESNPSFLPLRNGKPWDISKPGERNALIGRFKQNIEVERLGHTSLIGIRATTRQPALSNLIVNTLIDSYIEHSFRDNYETTSKISTWLASQLTGLKQKLEQSQAEMIDYQKDLGLVGLSSGGSNATNAGTDIQVMKLDEMNRQFATAKVDRMLTEARLQAIRSSSPGVIDATAATTDPALQANKAILRQLIDQYTSMSQSYGSAYPPLKALKAQIQQGQEGLAQEESIAISTAQKQYDTALASETMLRGALDADEQDAFNKQGKGAQFAFAREDYEANRLLYDGLQERLLEASILAGLHSTAIHIVDNADVPVGPSRPVRTTNLALGAGFGLILGFGLSLVREGLDVNLKTITDIEQALQLPLLAALPSVNREDLTPTHFTEVAVSGSSASWSRIGEALRSMRTSILLSRAGAPPKVIMVTSSRPAEGKTCVSALLAITFALGGSRVLLIDADLRRPNIHVRFGVSRERGLSSVLSGKSTVRETILIWPELPNLHLMPSGPEPPLPSELLGSAEMEEMLKGLREEYDFVLIDTPPVLVVTDAAVVGRLTDATVLIIRYGSAQRHVVQRCVHILDRSGAHLLGAAINVVDFEAPGYSEYYGKRYYEYYGKSNPQ